MRSPRWKTILLLGVLAPGCRVEGKEAVGKKPSPTPALHRQWSFEAGIDPELSIRFRASETYADEPLLDEQDPRPALGSPGAIGERALRIIIPARARVIFHTPVISTQLTSYTFSAYLRRAGDFERPSGVVLRIRRSHPSGGRDYAPSAEILAEQSAPLAADWSRVAIAGGAGGWVFGELEAEGPGELWLDAVRLERGAEPSRFSVEPELIAVVRGRAREPPDPVGVVTHGDLAGVEVNLSRRLASGERLVARVLDPFGDEASLALASVADEAGRWRAELPPPTLGPHRLRVELQDERARVVAAFERDFLVLDPPPPVEERARGALGTHTPLNARHLAIAARLGYGWLRLHDASMVGHWLVTAPVEGRSRYFDAQVDLAHRAGFGILGVLEQTPRWASSAPPELGWQQARSFPPARIGDWSAYVRDVVGHYRGRIDHWEVWNEPYIDEFWRGTPEQYRALVLSAVSSARAASDRAVLLASASGEPGRLAFTRSALAAESSVKFTDSETLANSAATRPWGLAFHAYDRRLADGTSVSTAAASELAPLRSAGAPFWQTEGTVLGASASLPAPWSRDAMERAGAALVAWVLELISRGAERVFTYSLVESDYGSDADLALLAADGSPRPPSAALATLAGSLSARRFERTASSRGLSVFFFGGSAGSRKQTPLAILSASEPFAVPASPPCALVDWNGNPVLRARRYRLLYCAFEESNRHRLLEWIGQR